MSIIKPITGVELEHVIAAACVPQIAWFDGTAETGGTSFVGFAEVMEQFALRIRAVAHVVLVDVEVWDAAATRYNVFGSPELVLFKNGFKAAHYIGTASLAELLRWADPYLGCPVLRDEWSDVNDRHRVGF